MTAPLADLFDEMAAKIDAVLVSEFPEAQVHGRRQFSPTPPSIDIYPGDPFRDSTDGTAGFQDVNGALIATVRARVNTADNFAGQELLLRLMDEEDDISVAAALMDDQTLNGLASSVSVDGNSGYLQYIDSGAQPFLGCEWRVRVLRVYS